MDRLGDARSWPCEGPDGDDAPRYALSHSDRQHITLENIELLAELDDLMGIEAGTRQASGPPPPGTAPAPAAADRATWVVSAAALPAAPSSPAPRALMPGAPREPGPRGQASETGERRGRDAASRPPRARWARPADRWLLETLAIAGASGAFVAPSAWLAGLVVVCALGGVVASRRSGQTLWSLPGRVVRRSFQLLHPRSLIWAPVLAARTVIVAVVVPAGVAAGVWLLDEGTGSATDGVVAAARLGAWADGVRVAVALMCMMLLTSVGDGREQRAAAVRRWASRLSDRSVAALAGVSLAVAATVVVALPHPPDTVAARADGLGWVPAGLRGPADRMRDDVVTAELDTLASCLSHHTDHRWRTSYTAENPPDQRDVARLVAGPGAPGPSSGELATAVVAAHNLLAPWVEAIEVDWAVRPLVRLDRDRLPRRTPLRDASLAAAAATTGRHHLDDQPADAAVVLRCSSAAVL